MLLCPEDRRPQTSSQYKGVSWDKGNRKWRAAIHLAGGKNKNLGSFRNEEEAAHAYDVGAIHFRGRGSELNFPYEDYVDEEGNWREDKYQLMIGEEAGPGPVDGSDGWRLTDLPPTHGYRLSCT